jgi:hypothetical protein
VGAAPEPLGVPTTGGGSAWPGGGGGESYRSKISPHENGKKRRFHILSSLKIAKKMVFHFKVTNKI